MKTYRGHDLFNDLLPIALLVQIAKQGVEIEGQKGLLVVFLVISLLLPGLVDDLPKF